MRSTPPVTIARMSRLRGALLVLALLVVAVPGPAVPASRTVAAQSEGAGAVVRRDRRRVGSRARFARREHPAPDRVADEGDDGADRDRARQSRGQARRHAARDPGGAVQGGPRRGPLVHQGHPALVGAARLEQRLRHGARDRCRRRLARRLLRARERQGARARDDVDDLRERVGPRRRPEPLDRDGSGDPRPRGAAEPDLRPHRGDADALDEVGSADPRQALGEPQQDARARRPAPTASRPAGRAGPAAA